MPARVAIVHDDLVFLEPLTAALRDAGHDVAAFDDPMVAWDALSVSGRAELLITRIQFGPGKPHGIALAQWARSNRSGIKVLFTARPEFEPHAEGLGVFLPTPTETSVVVEIVTRILASDPQAIGSSGVWPP
jgi:DNA-binding response OmpR family regulator